MSEGARTTIAAGVAMGLATMFVALRFYVRVRIKKDVEWNDWVLLIGLLMALLTGGLLLWGYLSCYDQGHATRLTDSRCQRRSRCRQGHTGCN